MNDSVIQIIQVLAPVVAAALTGGGVVAYFKYRESKPESQAKARQISVTSEISVADAWQKYAENIEKRFRELEIKYDMAIALKDKEIAKLQLDIELLNAELAKYRKIEVKMEVAKETIHAQIDESMDKITKPNGTKT